MTLVSLCLAAIVLAAPAEELAAARAKLDAGHIAELDKLAAKAEELGLKKEAELTKNWAVRRDPRRQYLFLVPELDPIPVPANPSLVARQWHAALTRERQRFGDLLLQHARDVLAAGDATQAMQLVHEVLRENPDQAEARRILGFRREGSRWTPTSEIAVTRPKQSHARFGWPGNSYFRLKSEHYDIATTAKREAALELAQKLEDLYCLWRQLHVTFWTDAATVQTWFAGPGPGLRGRPKPIDPPLSVILFADKKQYIAALQAINAQIAISEGIYIDADRTAYFYAGEEATGPTCFHEGTHQLFHEMRMPAPDVGGTDNFWIVEGAAMVMESLAKQDGYYTLGGLDASRLQFARNWALSGGFHVPVKELAAMARQPLQAHADIRKIYTESAGLTHFLLEGEGGKHRPILDAYLNMVYRGTAKPGTLPMLLGNAAPGIDRDYFRFLEVTDVDLASTRLLPTTRNLCLGRTGVTDVGLAQLGELKKLDWLDLSFTIVTDATIARLAGNTSLTQLNLEATKITDQSLATIATLTNLRELDLSQTKITNAGLKHLAGLKKLKVLWLTGADITDQGLPSLSGLKELETLDVEQTAVTKPAWERLKKQLPKVK